jgi:hypothetical protein
LSLQSAFDWIVSLNEPTTRQKHLVTLASKYVRLVWQSNHLPHFVECSKTGAVAGGNAFFIQRLRWIKGEIEKQVNWNRFNGGSSCKDGNI